MIRHTKEGIAEIPKPIRLSQAVRLCPSEAAVYNFYVSIAQSNLVLTGTCHIILYYTKTVILYVYPC